MCTNHQVKWVSESVICVQIQEKLPPIFVFHFLTFVGR